MLAPLPGRETDRRTSAGPVREINRPSGDASAQTEPAAFGAAAFTPAITVATPATLTAAIVGGQIASSPES